MTRPPPPPRTPPTNADPASLISAISRRLPECTLLDRARVRRRLGTLERALRDGKPTVQALAALLRDADQGAARRGERLKRAPRPTFPADLPVVHRKDDIAKAIRENQVVVLCGETGSGKTTQLPKICLELGRGVDGLIGHTQPRRIAARSVAARIADELGSPLGHAVGYKVRFGDHTSPISYLKVMTDGILLAETQNDRQLEQYDTLIIDEAHERSLNIDFLLGYVRQLLPRRPDLKVIITSATIDPERFSRHFGNAPIIMVSGRTYPVEVRYRPLVAAHPDEDAPDLEEAVLKAVDEVCRADPGDVLVFMSTEREIRETAEALRGHHPPGTEILPLFARLSAADQMKVFKPHRSRRIVIATNVAETSLTVPGIRHVIDPGAARISRYNPRNKVQRLPIEPISRASADQRKGRCGRTAPGICVRLYSETDFASRPEFTDPEVLRTNLASVILRMKSLGLGEVTQFPFIDPPDGRAIRDGYETLLELGAVDEEGALTTLGKELAAFPIDPRIARMILAARHEHCVTEVLVIAAALSVQDPRERPMDAAELADIAHAQWRDENSDFLSFLKLWRFYDEQSGKLSQGKLRKLCHTNFLSYVRMREWQDIHQQLQALVAEMGHQPGTAPATYDAIHRALLAGLLSNVATKADNQEYAATRSTKCSIFPGSALFKTRPKWIVAAEMVRTTKHYARCCAKVEPQWIERVAQHVLKRSYSEPQYDPDNANVIAFERVTLFGLPLVERRRVHYGPIDPVASRELFIFHALAEGQFITDALFMRHNKELIDEIKVLESKLRRPDLLADARRRFDFYAARVPDGVYNSSTFHRWRKNAEHADKRILFMTRADLLNGDPSVVESDFPDAMPAPDTGAPMPLHYRSEPGHADDGVTLEIPLPSIGRVDPERAEWLVPGLLREKIAALIKGLPKDLRTNFIPAPAYAEKAAAQMARSAKPADAGTPKFLESLSAALTSLTGIAVPLTAWNLDALPEHLRMNFRIVGENEAVVAAGRDLPKLKREVTAQLSSALSQLPPSTYNRTGVTEWDFGALPERVELDHHGLLIAGYPAVVDESPPGAALRLFETPERAANEMRGGLRRLFVLQVKGELDYHIKHLHGIQSLRLRFAPLGTAEELAADLRELIADRALYGSPHQRTAIDPASIRTLARFKAVSDQAWHRLTPSSIEIGDLAAQILGAHHAANLEAAALIPKDPSWTASVREAKEHLRVLLPKRFFVATPAAWLEHMPRFLSASAARLKKLHTPGILARDRANAAALAEAWRPLVDYARANPGPLSNAAVLYRWMLEEYRVSLFAQELGTSIPVSPQRLEKQWAKVVG